MGLPLDQLYPRARALVEAAMKAQVKGARAIARPTSEHGIDPEKYLLTKKRIRQHEGDGMNNWEREFLGEIRRQWPDCTVHREVSLPLANGVRYKLDFLRVINSDGGFHAIGFEVKGMARAAGIVKVKIAAQAYPWILFRLATKRRKKDGGGWAIEDVRP